MKKKILSILILVLIYVITILLAPYIVGKKIDEMTIKSGVTLSSFIPLITCYILIFVVNIILLFKINQIAIYSLKKKRSELFQKIQHLPIKIIEKYDEGKIESLFLTDIENIFQGLIQGISKIVIGIITIIGVGIIMLKLHKGMALIIFFTAPILYFISQLITKYTKHFVKKRLDKMASLHSSVEEMVLGQQTIRDFAYEKVVEKKFEDQNQELYNLGNKAQFYSSLANPISRFIGNLTYLLIGILGIYLIKKGEFSVGMIASFLLYSTLFLRPIQEITSILLELQTGIISWKRIKKFLNIIKEEETGIELPITNLRGEIKWEKVNFSYEQEKPFINDMSFEISQGETIAIVGETGSGKTTIANLMLRFYEIQSGKICIDGVSINEITKTFLRRNIGIVLQEPSIFVGSVRENILYGNEFSTDDEMKQAAKMAQAESFIERLQNGYNTIISNTDMLSASEKQRIAIARILLLKPPILILDEATSGIDLETEKKIQKAIDIVTKNRTSLIIAHRFSTIQKADRIFYLSNGKIIENGTHEELMKKKGAYYKLYSIGIED